MINVYWEGDVAVIGGGVSGVAAAIAAARNGAETLLVERYGFLGGTATTGPVRFFVNFKLGETLLARGIFEEILERLKGLDGYDERTRTFDPEMMKIVLEEMALEAGVKLLYHTCFLDAVKHGNALRGVLLHNKSGLQIALAKIVVDATGDGDVAVSAGAPFKKGRREDGLVQPGSLVFDMANVREEHLPSRKEFNRAFEEAKKKGILNIPRENVLWFKTGQKGVVFFNTTRVLGLDGTDAESLTRAEIEGRRQMLSFLRWVKQVFPGAFQDAYIARSGPHIGVRETRRIIGEYVLTGEDILSARKFPDAVCRANYPIDIHNPLGEGTVIKGPPKGDYYEIPYRCLVPLKVENLLVTGRCISATHEAISATRVMPTCVCLGQAAGTAAALSVKEGVTPRRLEPGVLRDTLRKQGVYV